MGCGCLIALLAWLSPRFAIILLQLFTDRMSHAMDSFLIGFAGFVFLPYTTVIYALAYQYPIPGVSGFGWVLVAAGFVADMSTWFGGGQQARQRQRNA
jgi:hypothetical protein